VAVWAKRYAVFVAVAATVSPLMNVVNRQPRGGQTVRAPEALIGFGSVIA
jgi:hypothetical protein